MNTITLVDAVEGLKTLQSSSVPLTLTSPPWDNLRDYSGHEWNFSVFKAVATELLRVTTEGGIVCWNHRDSFQRGSISGTGYRQTLYFKKIGFRIHEIIVLFKSRGLVRIPQKTRHAMAPEYMFVFAKGAPRCFNPRTDRRNQEESIRRQYRSHRRGSDGSTYMEIGNKLGKYGKRRVVWFGSSNIPNDYTTEHPARMQQWIAKDFTLTYSNRNDLVLDPFCGSGTTCEQAFLLGRKYIGFDIWDVAVRIARRRMREAQDKVWE